MKSKLGQHVRVMGKAKSCRGLKGVIQSVTILGNSKKWNVRWDSGEIVALSSRAIEPENNDQILEPPVKRNRVQPRHLQDHEVEIDIEEEESDGYSETSSDSSESEASEREETNT